MMKITALLLLAVGLVLLDSSSHVNSQKVPPPHRTAHTTAFDEPVVEHRLERKIDVENKLSFHKSVRMQTPAKAASRINPFDPCRGYYCRTGYYCVRREWRAVCVRKPLSRTCWLPMDKGPCNRKYPRYFYNRFTGLCEFFMYGGCGGNPNRFYSWWLCQHTCVNRIWPQTAGPISALVAKPKMYNADPTNMMNTEPDNMSSNEPDNSNNEPDS